MALLAPLLMALYAGTPIWANTQWTLGISGGADLGVGNGVLWNIYGDSEPSLTYFDTSTKAVGNTGVYLGLVIGYALTPDWTLVIEPGVIGPLDTLSSGFGYDSSGAVASNDSISVGGGQGLVSVGVRYTFLRLKSFDVSCGIHSLVVFPSDLLVTTTYPSTSVGDTEDDIYYGLGWGARIDVAGELYLTDNWGLVLSLGFEKIGIPRNTEDYTSDTKSVHIQYADDPKIDNNDQTAEDVQNSTSSKTYLTVPRIWDDVSNLHLRANMVWHF